MPYELLLDIGTAGMKRGIEYEVQMADFGGGWYGSAILDMVPIRTWELTWAGMYHDPYQRPILVQPRTTDGAKFGSPVSRPKYLSDFFTRRMTNGNDPFYLVDPFEPVDPVQPTYWLARLDMTSLQFQQQGEKQRWSYSVKVKFARIPGVPQNVTPTMPFPP
jgi:hypothetical protein